MTDILERLRSPTTEFLWDTGVEKVGAELLRDAADEIERLRKEYDDLGTDLIEAYKKVDDEQERCAMAIEDEIISTPDDDYQLGWTEALNTAADIIRNPPTSQAEKVDADMRIRDSAGSEPKPSDQ